MSEKEALHKLLQDLPEGKIAELLDFARFLSWQDDRREWQAFGQAQLAKAFGPDEPEYTMADLKPELNP